jgi:hypothetical protein
MQYLLLIHDDESQWDTMAEAERNSMYAEYGRFTQELTESGALVGANQLQPAGTATVVHVEDGGKTITTDGPFAETKEVLGGYYLVDVETLDEALEWAAKIPSARFGHIEVRPVVMREAEVAS